ncbi:MAG: DNA-processing protein DprA [Ruminococcus sp.]|nr:DNA-processing protein DprA [Ruminococcus sp.]
MDNRKYWLWLTMIFGVGSRRIWELMSLFETPDEAYYELRSGTSEVRLYGNEKNAVSSTDIGAAEQILAECSKKGIRTVSYDSEDYPPQLKHIINPPTLLYYEGDIRCLTGTQTVTTVGARKSCDYSLKVTDRICRTLSANGVVIVSGFAVGVDITSHMAAASQGRPTACILGCGVDVDYPRENFRYRDEIIAAGGVFVSEYPPGTTPHSANFPKRNRILAALGRATVVFEASEKSGSLITASLAAEQGRDVYCMPPADIFSDAFSGNCALLSEGAIPFFSAEDIAASFGYGTLLYNEIRSEAYSVLGKEAVPVKPRERRISPKEVLDTYTEASGVQEESPAKAEEKRDDILLEGVQKQIAETLSDGALLADELAERLSMDIAELMMELTEMEITGAVRSLPGKVYESLV